eukprot:gene8622-1035_t
MVCILQSATIGIGSVLFVILVLAPTVSCRDESQIGVWPAPVSSVCTGSTPRFLSRSFSITSTASVPSFISRRYMSAIRGVVSQANQWARKGDKEAIKGTVITISQIKIPDRAPSPEGYTIAINKNTVTIHAASNAGIVYALETFLQVMASGKIPCKSFEIKDAPSLQHRGLSIDIASRYLDLSTLRALLDTMPALKLNILNLHFSDYGAIRIRTSNSDLTDDLNGMYPRRTIQRLQQYASERAVTIVPDIEIPTHASGFKASELASFCKSPEPGLVDSVLNDDTSTMGLVNDTINELSDIFDSSHMFFVGGANVDKDNGNCTADNLQSVLLKAVDRAQVYGNKEPAVWDTANNAIPYLQKIKSTVFVRPSAVGIPSKNSVVLSGYRSENASTPSFPVM